LAVFRSVSSEIADETKKMNEITRVKYIADADYVRRPNYRTHLKVTISDNG